MINPISIFVRLAINIEYWFVLWFLLLLLSVVWSGFHKFIILMFFPGRVLHIATHFLVAKLLGLKFILYSSLRSFEDNNSKTVYFSGENISIRKIGLFVFSPAFMATLLGLILRQMLLFLLLSGKFDLVLLLAWLTLSFSVVGMPDRGDIELLFSHIIVRYPEFIIILLWVPIVYLVGLFSVGKVLALLGSFLFLLSASLILAFVPQQKIVVVE